MLGEIYIICLNWNNKEQLLMVTGETELSEVDLGSHIRFL